jgi:hypothetical protein
MQLGCSLPLADIGSGPAVLRDYAQAAEGLGYAHLVAPDHVLGANPGADHGGRRVGTTAGAGTPEDWRREIKFWREAGVTHVTAHTTHVSGHRKRISGRSVADHLTAITRYREAVADLL